MKISLRKVKKTDWDYIMKLRNESYENFYLQEKPLTKKEHYAYLKKQKTNSKFFNWIILKNEKEVGYVRLLNNDVSIIVDKKFQDKNIGTNTLKLLEEEAKKIGLKKLIALILTKNKTSKKIFEKNQYKLKQWWMEKEIN